MPKKNKVKISKAENTRPTQSRPEVAVRVEKVLEGKIKCTMCGKVGSTNANHGSFYKSNSILHRATDGYIPICKRCLEDLWNAYRKALGSDEDATRRLCMKIDAYWSDSTYQSMVEKHTTKTPVKFGEYMRILSIYTFRGKTYDTTLDEEADMRRPVVDFGEYEESGEIEATPEQIRIWGAGFDPLFYRELDQKYDYWTEDIDVDEMDKATESLIRQICIQEVILARDAAAGKAVDRTAKVIDSLLGSLNLKPVQKQQPVVDDGVDAVTEKTPFGMWIRRIEDDRPIPEPSEEFADVDHLKDYLQTWFVGGLCNMMRVPNKFSDKFEEAMMEYTVEKPEYEMDDNDTSLDALFEQAEKEGRMMNSEVDLDGWEAWETDGESEQE